MNNCFINGRNQFYYNGKLYDNLFTFDLEDGTTVIVFSDNTYDEDGNLSAYTAYLYESDEGIELGSLDSEKDYERVSYILSIVSSLVKEGLPPEDVERYLDGAVIDSSFCDEVGDEIEK